MQSTQNPGKIIVPFASGASASYVRDIPTPSQQSVTPGAASMTDGFPPLCFQPTPAYGGNGVPPDGRDMNGALKLVTQHLQWLQAGGAPRFDAALAASIGGYPLGAVLVNSAGNGLWISTAENNLTNPDLSGAGWSSFGQVRKDGRSSSVYQVTTVPTSTPVANQLTFTAPCDGVMHVVGSNSTSTSNNASFDSTLKVNGTQVGGSYNMGTSVDHASCVVTAGTAVVVRQEVFANISPAFPSVLALSYIFVPGQ